MQMIVRDVMTDAVVTVSPDMPVPDAVKLMKSRGIRRLPVVEEGCLIGIVSDRDLKEAMPSPATSLSIWEITALLANLPVKEVMSTSVLTVMPTTPLEAATQTMLHHKVGGLPVVNERREVVGIVTVTDVLRAFVNLTAAPLLSSGTAQPSGPLRSPARPTDPNAFPG
ncbi:CBS domain-containing protein [Deinococcus navajonensis]|uniref:CBS domain-containing protein n=1 Tax=Deinococcus navajonensis TaxID=309884 RepID=A0ABV8XMP8_9DEIO